MSFLVVLGARRHPRNKNAIESKWVGGKKKTGAFNGVWIICMRFGVGFVRDVGGSILGM